MTTVGLALTQPVSAEHHHEHIAMSTEKKLINIELDVLLEKLDVVQAQIMSCIQLYIVEFFFRNLCY